MTAAAAAAIPVPPKAEAGLPFLAHMERQGLNSTPTPTIKRQDTT